MWIIPVLLIYSLNLLILISQFKRIILFMSILPESILI